MSEQHRDKGLLHTMFIAFVLISCARMWIDSGSAIDVAQAQIPDSGLQRKQAIEEAARTNQLLSEIKQLLASGTLNVRIVSADNTSADKKAGARSKQN